MGKMIKLAWWKIGRGRMDKSVQEKFEKAQKMANDLGVPLTITLKITVKPPRKGESEYQPVLYSLAMPEPAYKSKAMDLVRRGDVAVSDAEDHPDQEHLDFPGEQSTTHAPSAERAYAP